MEAYYIRRAQAEMMPTRYFSIIMDGMDQYKTDLPHYQGWDDPNASISRRQQILSVKINSSVYMDILCF